MSEAYLEPMYVDGHSSCPESALPYPPLQKPVISLILPYWMRQAAADKALRSIEKHYSGMKNLEVVLVDDVSEVPFVKPEVDLHLRVIYVPKEMGRGSLVRTLNIGVANSIGDIIVLSMSEVIHEHCVLPELVATLKSENDYALAAAWCPEQKTWHCHSSIDPPFNPKGTGYAWLGAMHRSLYYKADGFDPDYGNGTGYSPFEDADFVNRMLRAGANFIHRDDLVVIHPKTGATVNVPHEAFVRNEAIFFSKWPVSKYPCRLHRLYL